MRRWIRSQPKCLLGQLFGERISPRFAGGLLRRRLTPLGVHSSALIAHQAFCLLFMTDPWLFWAFIRNELGHEAETLFSCRSCEFLFGVVRTDCSLEDIALALFAWL